MKRDYSDYLRDILDAIRETQEFTQDSSFKLFLSDKKTINAVVRSLEVIGEAAGKIPEEIRQKYPEIPWKRMIGMRNKLMHEYFGVDYTIVWTVVKEELPLLLNEFEKIIQP
ncbi:DUF86 domain-containing protein [bacterium]|nr:DUF86 domain-containing protein [bacterium]